MQGRQPPPQKPLLFPKANQEKVKKILLSPERVASHPCTASRAGGCAENKMKMGSATKLAISRVPAEPPSHSKWTHPCLTVCHLEETKATPDLIGLKARSLDGAGLLLLP